MTKGEDQGSGLDISLGDISHLEEVVDRESLRDVCRSFFDLFNLSVRIFSASGTLLADVHEDQAIHTYLKRFAKGRIALSKTIDAITRSGSNTENERQSEITGAVYDIIPLSYQGRAVGRIILGPYLPAELREVPRSLLSLDSEMNPEELRDALAQMPRVREATADRIGTHLRGIIDLLLFSSHRAHLTTEMHVASVRESYRELAEKTEKLQTAYDRLKELDRLKNNFLATVSHELRTPLTSIIGYSEMLEVGISGELNPEQREFVETIHAKGDQLLELITSLLDLSKLEQGVMQVNFETLHVAAIIEDIAKTFAPAARKKKIEVVVDVDEQLPSLKGDPLRIKQILSNLIENALKFTPEGGSVFLRAQSSDFASNDEDAGSLFFAEPRRAVTLEIRDTGIGMPRTELPHIFDAFYQVDGSSTREHGGTGLGLSIVKRLVDAHRGTIEVDSEKGKGTTFTITIPEE